MSLKKIALAALGLGFVISPLFTIADTNSNTGLLTVYVQVINPEGAHFSSSDFTVAVNGQSPSLTNFPGSIQGTVVSLSPGSFSVVVNTNLYGFTPSYSVGCNNTIAAGQSHTCIVTLSRSNYTYPTYTYTNPYTLPPLVCVPQNQTVRPGQPATFVAQGGVGGTYNWFANGRTYANVGPTFSAVIEYPGTSAVTVTNASQTATCNVTVSSNPGVTYPNYPYNYQYQTYPYTYPTYTTPTYPNYTQPNVYIYPTKLPNTGFEPQNGAQLAFALVLLMGAALASYPYVRKAFALAVR